MKITNDLDYSPQSPIQYHMGNNCVNKYWVWNDERNCISCGPIDQGVLPKTPFEIVREYKRAYGLHITDSDYQSYIPEAVDFDNESDVSKLSFKGWMEND